MSLSPRFIYQQSALLQRTTHLREVSPSLLVRIHTTLEVASPCTPRSRSLHQGMDPPGHLSCFAYLGSKVGSSVVLITSKSKSLLGNVKIHIAASIVQILYAGFQVLASAALSDGVSRYVFPVYRNVIAALLILPVALFLERGRRPPLTFRKFSQFFLCGLIGICINQTLFLAGLHYTSATFAATIQNLTPALTFGIAVLLGLERIHFRRREGQAKALGILICIGGATVIALYKGPSVVSVQGFSGSPEDNVASDSSSYLSWQLGALCLLGNCITWAVWFMLQTPVLKDYPAQLSAMAFTYTFGALQLFILAVCIERDPSTWASSFFADLPAVFYGGLIASGLAMTLQGWCAYHGGPVLVAAYQPLQTILVAILSSLFLQETFYLGSLLGGFLVIVGLYFLVWGKSRERRRVAALESMKEYYQEPPLIISTEAEATLVEPLLNKGHSIVSFPEEA